MSIKIIYIFNNINNIFLNQIKIFASWVGLGAVISYCFIYFGAFLAFILNIFNEAIRKILIVFHIILAHATFILGFLA